jgi:hypothetical protein
VETANHVFATCRLGFVPSFGTRLIDLIPPGTDVPGYRLCRPRSTSSGQALRDWLPCSVQVPSNLTAGADG